MSSTIRSDRHRRENNKTSGFKKLYQIYKSRAKKYGQTFELEYLAFIDLIKGNCKYCGKKPSRLFKHRNFRTGKMVIVFCYNGVDRIVNDIGYIKGNCVSCCTECNRMKSNFKENKFKKHISRIFKFTFGR